MSNSPRLMRLAANVLLPGNTYDVSLTARKRGSTISTMTKVKVYVKQDILVAVVVDTEDSSISSDYVLRPKEYLGLDGGQSYDQDFPEIYK